MLGILDFLLATTGFVATTAIGGWVWIAYEWRTAPNGRLRYRRGATLGLAYGLAVLVVGNLGPAGVALDGPVVDASFALPFVILSAYCAMKARRPVDTAGAVADAERWFAGLFEPRPTDREAALKALDVVRWQLGLRSEAVTWVRSPLEAIIAVRLLRSVDGSAPDVNPRLEEAVAGLNAAVPPGFTPDDWALRIDDTVPRLRAEPWAAWADRCTVITLDADRLAKRETASRLLSGPDALGALARQVRIHSQELAFPLGRVQTDRASNLMDAVAWQRLVIARAVSRFEGGPRQPLLDGLVSLFEASGGVILCRGGTIVIDRPLEAHRVDGQLHRIDGPALTFADGWRVHAIDGVIVPEAAVEAPDTLTHQDVTAWSTEARPLLMTRYGIERYRADLVRDPDLITVEPDMTMARAAFAAVGLERLMSTSGTVMHRDLDLHGAPRRLWSVEVAAIGTIRAVEVRNATPEPDGSWRTYYLRVPPTTRTCREAVAWTFRMGADDYATVFES